MPELPEVETMRRGILGIQGSRISAVERAPCRLKPILVRPRIDVLRRRVVGLRVLDVERIGKRVMLRLESGDGIVFEPRMTGLVLVADPPDEEHLRFRLALADGPIRQLWYWDRRGLGSVQLLSPLQLAELFSSGRIGPDALALSAEELRDRFSTSRREIKVALLDQRAIAGIGNLYASEILHVAAVHPGKLCHRITRQEWQTIHAAMIAVLNDAIRYEGSTLGDGTYRNALNRPGEYQKHHRVYDRAHQRCLTCCTAEVKRIVQGQRSTFYCPRCQPGRRSSRHK